MRSIQDTIARLSAMKHLKAPFEPVVDRLKELTSFGSNPGQLRARYFVPSGPIANAPLVVVLHGCLQTAAGNDYGAGWSQLAQQSGFVLLLPEQQRSNNPNLCFNWFQPGDTRRDQGEALSIRQMVEQMVLTHGLNRNRIFVTGLSAGGAMAGAMLATYPDIFAGGAIIAGLPYGAANSVPEAFDRMRGHGGPARRELGRAVQGASSHTGPWQRVSIWHGDADRTVAPSNARSIADQWLQVHELNEQPTLIEEENGYTRRLWSRPDGVTLVEDYSIEGMGHGTPLDLMAGGYGAAGAYMLDAGISSTEHIAYFWGIAPAPKKRIGKPANADAARAMIPWQDQAPKDQVRQEQPRVPSSAAISVEGRARKKTANPSPPQLSKTLNIQKVIEDALRTAGLMK